MKLDKRQALASGTSIHTCLNEHSRSSFNLALYEGEKEKQWKGGGSLVKDS